MRIKNKALVSIMILSFLVLLISPIVFSKPPQLYDKIDEDGSDDGKILPDIDKNYIKCIITGGKIEESLCCEGVQNFPNTCVVGACGCPPEFSEEVKICNCGRGKCWNGNGCVEMNL